MTLRRSTSHVMYLHNPYFGISQSRELCLPSALNSQHSLVVYLQHDLDIIRVAFALLVSAKLRSAVQQRRVDAGLMGVDRRGRNERGRGRIGHRRAQTAVATDRHDGSLLRGNPRAQTDSCRLSNSPEEVKGQR